MDKIQQANFDKIIEASNVGVLDEKDFRDQYANLMKWPQLTEEQATQIKELAKKAQEKPEGRQRLEATRELMKYIAGLDNVDWLEVGKAVWYANMLSGPSTQALNVFANAGEMLSEVYVTSVQEIAKMLRSGKSMSPIELAKALWNGTLNGVLSGWDVLAT